MIREKSGDLLAPDAEALAYAVNTVGVMGKGIALQFKQTYPDMFREYAQAARAGDLHIGRMFVWQTARRPGRGSQSTFRRSGAGAWPVDS